MTDSPTTFSLELRPRLPEEELRVFCDRGRLVQVLYNLLDNACKWARSRVAITSSIGEDRLAVDGRQHVGGLQVAVQHPGPVGRLEAAGELDRDGHRVAGR